MRVFAELQKHEPVTMQDLIDSCRSSMNRASVYRTITLFEKLGIAQRLQMGWKYRWELNDSFHHHHHHMYCTSCSRIIALAEDGNLEERLAYLASSAGFAMADHQLEIRGICTACRGGNRRVRTELPKRPGEPGLD